MSIFYYPLESIPERYTRQLSEEWMPLFFAEAGVDLSSELKTLEATTALESHSIKTGSVLDATRRGLYSMYQNQAMLREIEAGRVRDDDAIFLQDFWTPGFEAVLYSLHLHGIRPRIYAMLHAQSVDEYDFTYPMRSWMRPIEVGLANAMTGIFVASTVHRDQLKSAGIETPIHVVGLPLYFDPSRWTSAPRRENKVVYSSRLDWEKNPYFMLKVAEVFLQRNEGYRWVVTTSSPQPRSNDSGVVDALAILAMKQPRFVVKTALTKDEYYSELSTAAVQFNCSLQDYVSWTLLEATACGCDVAYPAHRSFPECLPPEYLYHPGTGWAAVEAIERAASRRIPHLQVLRRCLHGWRKAAVIVSGGTDTHERNTWLEG